ncbi:hypothetical protein SIK47_13110, partial [Clostridioides difficile]|nr:hypothetical protein [Clostridioides difficile]
HKFEFVCNKVNDNILKLNLPIIYNGKNSGDVKLRINEIKSMHISTNKKDKTISELEYKLNSIDK